MFSLIIIYSVFLVLVPSSVQSTNGGLVQQPTPQALPQTIFPTFKPPVPVVDNQDQKPVSDGEAANKVMEQTETELTNKV